MCMKVNDKVTKRVKARLKRGKGVARFWKVYKKGKDCLMPWIYGPDITTAGHRTSNRQTTRWPLAFEPGGISRGFHVFSNRADAQNIIAGCYSSTEYVCMPVYCRRRELVVGGGSLRRPQAVFTHIEIKPEDFAKAIGK